MIKREDYFKQIESYAYRKCPICGRNMDADNYYRMMGYNNREEGYSFEESKEIWSNPILAIPCCKCYEIIMMLKDSEWSCDCSHDVKSNGDKCYELYFYKYAQNKTYIISEKAHERLQLFGLIKKGDKNVL